MPFTLQHNLVSETLFPETHQSGPNIHFSVFAQGEFDLLYPGRLLKQVTATVRHSMRFDIPDTTVPSPPGGIDSPGGFDPPFNPNPQLPHNGVVVTLEAIPFTFRIFDPRGAVFTRDEVTIADLKKFRDLRGTPVGRWRYTLSGQSRVYTPNATLNESVTEPTGVINLGLFETIPSSSAPPLVARARVENSLFRTSFDLNRVGSFVATIVPAVFFGRWRGSMRLIDPDGREVASSTSRTLRTPILLSMLGKSRDAAGNPRLWTLEVLPRPVGLVNGDVFVTATVLGEGRFSTAALTRRIQAMLGPSGSFIKLVGENRDGRLRAMLTINDVVAAETFDVLGILDSRLKKENQSTDIEAGKPMVLYERKGEFDHDITIDVSTMALRSIDIHIGPGQRLGAETPVIRLTLKTEGKVNVKWRGITLANAKLRNGQLVMEVGIRIDPDGTPRIVQSVPRDVFDIDISTTVALALIAVTSVFGFLGVKAVTEYVEAIVNGLFVTAVRDLFADPSLAPRILMTIFGTHLTYLPPRFEGEDILFEHVAPVEPDLKPRRNYAGAIGRTVLQAAAGHPTFIPATLGDTWKADNLKNKIEHIVVVMMENRSYDHVLGYRAQAPISDGSDGLTPEMMASINTAAEAVQALPAPGPSGEQLRAVHPLRKALFESNEVQLKTRIPKSIGHKLPDVSEQLQGQADGPNGRRIIDPRGFIENFRDKRLGGDPNGVNGCTPFTVLGYYEKIAAENVDDLPMTAFLAENYAYCDRYFSAHSGPTLPNRTYSLTGDLQYDRLGVPIVDNNHGDNVILSRATTIFDLLTRQGVGWRVYESFPSVTMLRMFARYATDTVNIRPICELAADVAEGNLPALTIIEPSMHHHPKEDDHPPVDMYRGQHFLRRVYETLRSNPTTWRNTLLVITYDEHGGLYDHVIPPVADVLHSGRPDLVFDPDSTTGTLIDHDSGGGSNGGSGGGLGATHGFHLSTSALNIVLGDFITTDVLPIDKTLSIPYGVRVPMLLVSPWVTPGKKPEGIEESGLAFDHCSILKTVLARFCGDVKPFLSDRVRVSHSFESFLNATEPRTNIGAPPALQPLLDTPPQPVSSISQIDTPPLYRKRMRNESVDYHDISGRLARLLGR